MALPVWGPVEEKWAYSRVPGIRNLLVNFSSFPAQENDIPESNLSEQENAEKRTSGAGGQGGRIHLAPLPLSWDWALGFEKKGGFPTSWALPILQMLELVGNSHANLDTHAPVYTCDILEVRVLDIYVLMPLSDNKNN